VLARLGADAVLCPFTASGVRDVRVPLVALLADLQYLSHPHLLTSMQRAARARMLAPVRRSATRIVCPSEALRREAIELAGLPAERVVRLAPGRLLVQPRPAPEVTADVLARYGLGGTRYLLLAGGGAARHNQALALAAFGLLRARRPDSPLRLVCVGGPAWLHTAAARMGCGEAVRLLGPLPAATVVSLVDGAAGVLVTALYETLGEHVLQAMALGRGVLCSDLPSLLELVGDAALSFDPHRPTELAALLERVDRQPETLAEAGRRGQRRFMELEEPAGVARRYVDLLLAARTWCPTSR
jgi:glycosyltransferase involved in cell wall biosynthesis